MIFSTTLIMVAPFLMPSWSDTHAKLDSVPQLADPAIKCSFQHGFGLVGISLEFDFDSGLELHG
jgi:hypothetical protein